MEDHLRLLKENQVFMFNEDKIYAYVQHELDSQREMPFSKK
jgi:hypothetical protein